MTVRARVHAGSVSEVVANERLRFWESIEEPKTD